MKPNNVDKTLAINGLMLILFFGLMMVAAYATVFNPRDNIQGYSQSFNNVSNTSTNISKWNITGFNYIQATNVQCTFGTGNFSGNFTGAFQGTFTGNFSGNFTLPNNYINRTGDNVINPGTLDILCWGTYCFTVTNGNISAAAAAYFSTATSGKPALELVGNGPLLNLTNMSLSNGWLCNDCIKPRDINDVDDEDVESDINTYVDVAGDVMVGPLNISFNASGGLTVMCFESERSWCFRYNGTGSSTTFELIPITNGKTFNIVDWKGNPILSLTPNRLSNQSSILLFPDYNEGYTVQIGTTAKTIYGNASFINKYDMALGNTTTGTNNGTSLCIGSYNKICKCGSCE